MCTRGVTELVSSAVGVHTPTPCMIACGDNDVALHPPGGGKTEDGLASDIVLSRTHSTSVAMSTLLAWQICLDGILHHPRSHSINAVGL